MAITLGQYVARRRTELGMKQHELAKAAGLTRPYISKIEHDQSKDPRYALIVRLAEALDDDPLNIVRATGMEDKYRGEMPAKRDLSHGSQRVLSAINTRFRFLTDEQAEYALRFFGSLVGEAPPDQGTGRPSQDSQHMQLQGGV